jgi:hypothetical protein
MANKKISQLTALTAANIADILAIVDDVLGTPITKYITAQNLLHTAVDYRDITEQSSAPDTPASGDLRFYAGDDSTLRTKDDAGNVNIISMGGLAHVVNGRLTLTTDTPIITSSVTDAESIYFTPYMGNVLRLYSSTESAWNYTTFSELEYPLTDTQSCTLVNGDATVTVADSSLFVVGMEVTGTGVAGSTTIASITDGTTIEMSANATSDITTTLTFKVPADTAFDLFVVNDSGTVKFARMILWTNTTTRATALGTQDGVYVESGTEDNLYVGSGMTDPSTAGVTSTALYSNEWYLWNYYNQEEFALRVQDDSATALPVSSSTWEVYNADADNSILFFVGVDETFYTAQVSSISAGWAAARAKTSISQDDSTVAVIASYPIIQTYDVGTSDEQGMSGSSYRFSDGAGYHRYYIMFWMTSANSQLGS